MEWKGHPWSGFAVLPAPVSRSPRLLGTVPGQGGGTGNQSLPMAWQDGAFLHQYFIASTLADLPGCCLG